MSKEREEYLRQELAKAVDKLEAVELERTRYLNALKEYAEAGNWSHNGIYHFHETVIKDTWQGPYDHGYELAYRVLKGVPSWT